MMNQPMGGMQGEPDGDEMGDEQMMQELMEAMKAGDDAESEGADVSPVMGTDSDGGQSGENQMDPEKLKELLEMLKGAGGGSVSMDVGGAGGGMGGKY